MISEAIAGLSIFNSILDMTKGLKDINDAAVRNTAVVELTEKIIAAQTQQMALVQKVNELEQEVVRFETWETDKQRYELKPVGDREVLVYTLKDGVEPPESPHHICANCYSDHRKSILQPEQRNHGRAHLLVCNGCGAEIYVFGSNPGTDKPRAGAFGRGPRGGR